MKKTTTTEAKTTTTASASTPEAKLTTLLMKASTLGPTFTEEAGDTTSGPGPCGADVDKAVAPDYKVSKAYTSDKLQLAAQQVIRVYSSSDVAGQAYTAFVKEVSCGAQGGGGTITLGTPTDITDQLGITGVQATAVTIKGADSEGVGIVATYADLVTTFQFLGAPGAAEAAGAPSPVDIAKGEIQSIVDTIG